MKVVRWICYADTAGMTSSIGGLGGWVDPGVTWPAFLEALEPERRPYYEALRAEIVARKLWHSGDWHQDDHADGVPVFEDETIATLSFRAWGDLMAAIWNTEIPEAPYSYMSFYVDSCMADSPWEEEEEPLELECRYCEEYDVGHACIEDAELPGIGLIRLYVLRRNGPVLARKALEDEREVEFQTCAGCGCTGDSACSVGCGWAYSDVLEQVLDARGLTLEEAVAHLDQLPGIDIGPDVLEVPYCTACRPGDEDALREAQQIREMARPNSGDF